MAVGGTQFLPSDREQFFPEATVLGKDLHQSEEKGPVLPLCVLENDQLESLYEKPVRGIPSQDVQRVILGRRAASRCSRSVLSQGCGSLVPVMLYNRYSAKTGWTTNHPLQSAAVKHTNIFRLPNILPLLTSIWLRISTNVIMCSQLNRMIYISRDKWYRR